MPYKIQTQNIPYRSNNSINLRKKSERQNKKGGKMSRDKGGGGRRADGSGMLRETGISDEEKCNAPG